MLRNDNGMYSNELDDALLAQDLVACVCEADKKGDGTMLLQ